MELHGSLELLTGTTGPVTFEVPSWAHIADSTVVDARGLTVEVTHHEAVLVVTVTAPTSTGVGTRDVNVEFTGCAALIDEACRNTTELAGTATITVEVTEPSADLPDGFPDPDERRWVPQGEGTAVLPGELSVHAAVGAAPGDVAAVIVAAGGGVTGADPALGLYQARFADTAAAAAVLEQSALIEVAQAAVGSEIGLNAEPLDWSDDGPDATWTFRQAGAPAAWDLTRGADSVQLGIIDVGIYPRHPDLRNTLSHPDYTAVAGDEWKAWRAGSHGTHVAGTMCLADGNGGLVGVSQRCRLHAFDLGGAGRSTLEHRLSQIGSWLRLRRSIRVVNISLSLKGAHAVNECRNGVTESDVQVADRLFAQFPDTLFVVAAGNCGAGGERGDGKRRSVEDSIPSANSRTSPNVLSVSATGPTNSFGEVPLTYYSATDGDVAAPGGDDLGTDVWSTTHRCAPWRPFVVQTCESTWGKASGTSMAAPFVAGTAGLMVAVHPKITTAELRLCLTSSANVTDVYDPFIYGDRQPIRTGLRQINVRVAVECARELRPSDPIAAPTMGKGPLTVFFDASWLYSPYCDTGFTRWEWDFGDGATGGGVNPIYTYAAPGSYVARVTATGEASGGEPCESSAATTIDVFANYPPVAVAEFAHQGGRTVEFSSSGSNDYDGVIVQYLWDFGDGTRSTRPNPTHTYTAAGTYHVTLTVTDDDFVTGETTVVVHIL